MPSTASTTTTPPPRLPRLRSGALPTHTTVASEFAEAMLSSPKVFSSTTTSRHATLRRLLSTPAFSAACLLFGLAGFLAGALSISWSPGSTPRARCPNSSHMLSVSVTWDGVGPAADDGAGLVGGGRRPKAAEVDGAEYDEQPVEAVEPPVIEVINELAAVSAMAGEGDLVHDDDEQRAEEQADGAHAQEQTRVHGLHPFGVWILAEEDVEEHVGETAASAGARRCATTMMSGGATTAKRVMERKRPQTRLELGLANVVAMADERNTSGVFPSLGLQLDGDDRGAWAGKRCYRRM
uniref:Uncharacterized protein n=1 Tax=Oryza sativa subsp. japonica TaxID=39947 RepID=Q2R094_ORYSJ|nr:hypothetical protein LOC_Os11g43340 [Oryza sativa Japonica Group]